MLSALKANGFRWSPGRALWYKARGGAITSEFASWLTRAQGGPKRPDGPCWICKSPEGYFRPHGAAAPVFCDPCEIKSAEKNGQNPRRDPGEDAADRWNESHR